MTDENLQELEEFWDGFAKEYEDIQQESPFPIAEGVKQFLLEQQILPCHSLLDLAGGSGRYLVSLQEAVWDYTLVDLSEEMLAIAQTKQKNSNVQFIQQDQETFFQTNSQTFDVAFTAMNPALMTKEALLNFTAKSHGWCVILRLVQQTDSLFSPYEPAAKEPNLMENYQQFLKEAGIAFSIQDFVFTSNEEITREFFEAYFKETYSPQQIQQLIAKHFPAATQVNQQTIRYQLLYYPSPNKKEISHS